MKRWAGTFRTSVDFKGENHFLFSCLFVLCVYKYTCLFTCMHAFTCRCVQVCACTCVRAGECVPCACRCMHECLYIYMYLRGYLSVLGCSIHHRFNISSPISLIGSVFIAFFCFALFCFTFPAIVSNGGWRRGVKRE